MKATSGESGATGKRSLLGEDEDGLRRQMQWALAPHNVLSVATREEALQVFAKTQAQLVVLDLGLPPDPDGTSEGLLTLKTFFNNPPYKKVKIVSRKGARKAAFAAIGRGAF